MAPEPLPFEFFEQPTLVVARTLLGKILVRQFEKANLEAEIVEVEAYTEDDPACHAYGGKRPRCEVMFGPPGRTISDEDVATSSRIGITKAVDRPWRFYLKDDKSVSRRK